MKGARVPLLVLLALERLLLAQSQWSPRVVFAPSDADAVGVYDVSTESFSASVSTGSVTMNYKFSGAAAVAVEATSPLRGHMLLVYMCTGACEGASGDTTVASGLRPEPRLLSPPSCQRRASVRVIRVIVRPAPHSLSVVESKGRSHMAPSFRLMLP